MNRLKSKIETEYKGTKVALAGHSYGGVAAYEFLTEMTDEWKAEHISHYIPIGAPFGGAIGTVISTAAGYALDIPIPKMIRRKILWPVQSAAPSGAYLMPVRKGFECKHHSTQKQYLTSKNIGTGTVAFGPPCSENCVLGVLRLRRIVF